MKPDLPPALAKAGKREVAFALLAVWLLATARLFVFLDAQTAAAYGTLYETLTLAVFFFMTGAFGMQVYQQVQAQKNPWPWAGQSGPPQHDPLPPGEHHKAG